MSGPNGANQLIAGLKKIFSSGPPKVAVGIDIGSRGVKVIELERQEDGNLVLKNYVYAKTHQKLIKIGTTGLLDPVAADLLAKVMSEAGIRTKGVNVAVPSFASLVTVFEIPPMNEDEIEKVIRIEAPKYIPVRLEDVVFGWQVINIPAAGQEKETGGGPAKPSRIRVLVVAIMRDISQQYEKVFGQARLAVNSLEIDSFSLVRSLVRKDPGCYMILDLGHKVTNVIIVSGGNILLNQTIDVAGERFTSVIERGIGIDVSRAEQMKLEQGMGEGADQSKQVILPALGIVTDEIRRMIKTFSSSYPELAIQKIVLTGGSSMMTGLREYLQLELNIETIIGNPMAGIRYDAKLENVIASSYPFFAVAVGLALLAFEESGN